MFRRAIRLTLRCLVRARTFCCAYAACQYFNDFEYQGLDGTDQATADRVGALYKYLTGEKNVGLKETAKPTVEIKGENGTFKAGDPVGPIRFESNQATVKLTNELKYDLVEVGRRRVKRPKAKRPSRGP